jgi:hypothetical protein
MDGKIEWRRKTSLQNFSYTKYNTLQPLLSSNKWWDEARAKWKVWEVYYFQMLFFVCVNVNKYEMALLVIGGGKSSELSNHNSIHLYFIHSLYLSCSLSHYQTKYFLNAIVGINIFIHKQPSFVVSRPITQ